jgi:putative endonuclease
MYYTYVLYSPAHNRFYKGHCKNPEQRLKEHNSGKTKSIRAYIPWQIIYLEEFNTLEQAIKREKFFKSATGRKFIKSVVTL